MATKPQSSNAAVEAFLAAKRKQDPNYGKVEAGVSGITLTDANWLWEMGLQQEAKIQARGEA